MQGLSLTGSCQGDKVAAEIFDRLGVVTREVRSPYRKDIRSITVEGSGTHENAIDYNFIDCPDLMPPVLVTCAALGVKARLKGVKNLSIKECDRLQVLSQELGKMGCRVSRTENEIRIFPGTNSRTLKQKDIQIDVHNDHRMAMSFGILTLLHPGIEILNPASVTKSFPGFWEQMKLIQDYQTL